MVANISTVLESRAYMQPELEALYDVHMGRRFSFRELNERVNQTANLLAGLGVAQGDRVAVLLPNGHPFIETYFAIAKLGAVVVPLNWRLASAELDYIVQDSGAATLVFGEEYADLAAALQSTAAGLQLSRRIVVGKGAGDDAIDYETGRAQQSVDFVTAPGGEAVLYVMYTSGTTGRPKGAIHTHASALWSAISSAATLLGRPGDRMLSPMPLFHVGGIGVLNFSFYMAKGLVLTRMFDPDLAWRLIEAERVTNMMAVPAMLSMMLDAPSLRSVSALNLADVSVGAAPVPLPLIEAYAERGIALQQVYGLTESAGVGVYLSSEYARSKAGSAGRAMFHTGMKLIDADGRTVSAGSTGEILLSGPNLMKGYWNLPHATADTLRDGWLHTGDIGVLDDQGFVSIRDRIKDMIITGGENVYPAEVESVLLEHISISDVAVIGRPDQKWGESPIAIVVAREQGLSEAEVIAFARTRLAGYKCPAQVHFVDVMPRNASGKILKTELRQTFVPVHA